MERGEVIREIPKDVSSLARDLCRETGLPVGIGEDMSLTVGNVTFLEEMYTVATPEGLSMLVVAHADNGPVARMNREKAVPVRYGDKPVDEPGWEGWRESTVSRIEKPEYFVKVVRPPSNKIIRGLRSLIFGEPSSPKTDADWSYF